MVIGIGDIVEFDYQGETFRGHVIDIVPQYADVFWRLVNRGEAPDYFADRSKSATEALEAIVDWMQTYVFGNRVDFATARYLLRMEGDRPKRFFVLRNPDVARKVGFHAIEVPLAVQVLAQTESRKKEREQKEPKSGTVRQVLDKPRIKGFF